MKTISLWSYNQPVEKITVKLAKALYEEGNNVAVVDLNRYSPTLTTELENVFKTNISLPEKGGLVDIIFDIASDTSKIISQYGGLDRTALSTLASEKAASRIVNLGEKVDKSSTGKTGGLLYLPIGNMATGQSLLYAEIINCRTGVPQRVVWPQFLGRVLFDPLRNVDYTVNYCCSENGAEQAIVVNPTNVKTDHSFGKAIFVSIKNFLEDELKSDDSNSFLILNSPPGIVPESGIATMFLSDTCVLSASPDQGNLEGLNGVLRFWEKNKALCKKTKIISTKGLSTEQAHTINLDLADPYVVSKINPRKPSSILSAVGLK